jgi:tRNA dimethylallyltransferase
MNTNAPSKPSAALIAGPTASGKSALALALAEAANGVVINADSAQVYRDLAIVSARPGPAEMARAPHRLYGTRDGADSCSAADWAADARAEIAAAHEAGRLPILAGGTGLYLRTLIEGIAPVPVIDPAVRAGVRALTAGEAHATLAREDPAAAARIRPGDTTRAQRALEVVRATGRTLRDWQAEKVGGISGTVALRPLILLPPRAWLHARCDERFEKIFSDEGIEEIRLLLARRLPALAPVMRAIGVREIAAFLGGEISRAQALAAGKIATRQYAKRQYTWFRRQPPADWPRFEAALEGEEVERALALLSSPAP